MYSVLRAPRLFSGGRLAVVHMIAVAAEVGDAFSRKGHADLTHNGENQFPETKDEHKTEFLCLRTLRIYSSEYFIL